MCVCSTEGSKRFQLWPERKDVLFEDIQASALLQIRGLKLTAATDQRAEIFSMCQSPSFLHCFFSFLFYTLFTLPSFPLLPACTALLCLSTPLSNKEYSFNLHGDYSPLDFSLCCLCLTTHLTYFSCCIHLALSFISAWNPIDKIILINTKGKSGLVCAMEQWIVLCHLCESLWGRNDFKRVSLYFYCQ